MEFAQEVVVVSDLGKGEKGVSWWLDVVTASSGNDRTRGGEEMRGGAHGSKTVSGMDNVKGLVRLGQAGIQIVHLKRHVRPRRVRQHRHDI